PDRSNEIPGRKEPVPRATEDAGRDEAQSEEYGEQDQRECPEVALRPVVLKRVILWHCVSAGMSDEARKRRHLSYGSGEGGLDGDGPLLENREDVVYVDPRAELEVLGQACLHDGLSSRGQVEDRFPRAEFLREHESRLRPVVQRPVA